MEDNYVLHLEPGALPRYISYINANVMNGATAIRRLMTWKIKVRVCVWILLIRAAPFTLQTDPAKSQLPPPELLGEHSAVGFWNFIKDEAKKSNNQYII